MNLVRKKQFYKDYDFGRETIESLLNDIDLVRGLARWNKGFAKSDFSQNMEILRLGDGQVAKEFAQYSPSNKWAETPAAQKLEVLSLKNGEVARKLALYSKENGWGETEAAQKREVLSLCDGVVAISLSRDFVKLKKDNNPSIYRGREWENGGVRADEGEAIELAYKWDVKNPVWACVDDGDVNHCLVVCEEGVEFDRRDVWEMSDDVWFLVDDFLEGKDDKFDEWERRKVREWVRIIECEKIDVKVYLEYKIKEKDEEEISINF